MTNSNLIIEDVSFLYKVFRYLKELFLSVQNFPFEFGLNRNVPNIKNIDQTIDLILKGFSIVRFGDGEFRLINGFSIPYQKFDISLQNKLKQIFKTKNKKLLIGLPDTFSSLNQFTFSERIFWRKYMTKNRNSIYKLINFNNTFVSSFFSRPYLRFKDKTNISNIFKKIKKIWNQKNILIIEGQGTRIGVNNDLLNNAASIKRILCPDINAYEKYSQILKQALSTDCDLILIALGPTAKLLCFELSKHGIQTVDVGHLDIEYEWFKSGTKKRIPIPYKNVLEANSYLAKECLYPNYLQQIVAIIK